MRTIRLDDFSLWEDGVRIPWPEKAIAIRLDDFTFVDKEHKPLSIVASEKSKEYPNPKGPE